MGLDLKKSVSSLGAGVGNVAGAVGGAIKGVENSSVLDSMRSLGGKDSGGDAWEMGPIVQGYGNGAGNGGKGGGGKGGPGSKGGSNGRASMSPSFPSTAMA